MPSILHLCQWIYGTQFSTAIRESPYWFPLIEGVHTLGITAVVGTVAVLDLRLLGFDYEARASIAYRSAGAAVDVVRICRNVCFWIAAFDCRGSDQLFQLGISRKADPSAARWIEPTHFSSDDLSQGQHMGHCECDALAGAHCCGVLVDSLGRHYHMRPADRLRQHVGLQRFCSELN